MTVSERIKQAVSKWTNINGRDDLDKLLLIAYHTGQTHATRRICDEYSVRISKALQACEKLRYHKMAASILPAPTIQDCAYAGDEISTWGGDSTKL